MSFPWLIFSLIVLWFIARYFGGLGIGAPWLPVRRRDISDAFSLVDVGAHDTVLDLGSGDGRLLIEAAKRGASVIGYELNPFLVWISRLRLRRFKHVSIHRQNLLEADLSKANVIFVFGITSLMPKIAKKIMQECKPGTAIISFAFDLPGLIPSSTKGVAHLYIR